jgi:predicted secreted hydrolase
MTGRVFLLIATILLASAVNAADASEWQKALGPRVWTFPRDHGAHPEYRTEWWYFTGNLRDDAGGRYGYQLTFFRQGLRSEPPPHANAWYVRDVYLAHFAIADRAKGRFHWAERSSRGGPGLAGASDEGMDVWTLNWSARMTGGSISLQASHEGMSLELELRPRKALVFHGQEGLSRKGPGAGQASYYASFTDLETRGRLKPQGNDSPIPVQGTSWFDQEFGSNQLGPDQVGWDWFSLHLSDGRDVMIYLLRLRDGGIEPASSGTLVEPDGSSWHLPLASMRISVLAQWRSPQSGGVYPSRWRVEIPSAQVDLEIAPLLPDQELQAEASTGVTYWEGAVEGQGRSGGKPVTCEGYAELTGYAGSLAGVF